MILNDTQIAQRVGMIVPYDPGLQNGESYDLTLGDTLLVRRRKFTWKGWQAYWHPVNIAGTSQESPYYLKPGDRFLGYSSQELNIPPDLVAWGFLKSSRARELLQHLHATFIDATFKGNLTFEFINHDIVKMPIWEGKRVFQLVFAKTTPAMNPYCETGHYQGDKGVQQSKGYFE